MYLRSIALSQVGLFSGPVSITGISPGLNLLAAPNEAGKSTLFRALETLFRHSHTSRKQELHSLRPFSGGAPRITCRFMLDGREWELRKQFLSSPLASLRSVDGQVNHQDREVDSALANLLSKGCDRTSFFPVVWIGQHKSIELPELDEKARDGLTAVLLREATDAAAGEDVVRIQAAVLKELKSYLTDTLTKPRKDGPLDAALRAVEGTRLDLQRAEAELEGAQGRLRRVEQLSSRLNELRDPAVQHATEREIATCEKRLSDWETSAKHLAAAELADQKAQNVARLARQRFEAARELVGIVATIDGRRAELAAAEAALRAGNEDLRCAEGIVAAISAARSFAEKQVERSRLEEARQETRTRLGEITRQVERVRELNALYQMLSKEIDANPVTDGVAQRLADWQNECERLDGQLKSAAPTLCVRYESGVADAFLRDGQPLAANETVVVAQPVTIVVPGMGSMTIAPGNHSEVGEWRQRKTHLAKRLSEEFERLGVASPSEISERVEARRRACAELQAVTVSLRELAPDGVKAVEAVCLECEDRLADLDRRLTQVDSDIAAWEEDATAVIDHLNEKLVLADLNPEAVSERLREARANLAGVRAGVSKSERLIAELRIRLEHLENRRSELSGILNVECVSHEDVERWETDHRAAEAAADDAARMLAVWRAGQPDPLLKQQVSERLDGLRQSERRRAAAIYDAEIELAACEAQILQDRQKGLAHRVRELASLLEHHGRRLHAVECHVAALKLLLDEFRAARSATAASTVGPTVERLQALASPLFGRDALALDGIGSAPVRQTDCVEEPWQLLSGGTREQIAVLARLAYAGVLADGGKVMPVILDDALVYSDRTRLQLMFRAFVEAAEKHQVIVLSCHEDRFRSLVSDHGATELRMEHQTKTPKLEDALAL